MPGTDPEVLVERCLDALSRTNGILPPESADVLLLALAVSQDTSTLWRLTFALGRTAPADRIDVVDTLSARFREWRSDPFLAPEALDALAALAERSPLARAEVQGHLLRLTNDDTRYLLVRAAKVIARLECIGFVTDARMLLDRWADHEDPAISAEAHHQLAVLCLNDALHCADLAGIRRALDEARSAFIRAELSEESRFDARLCSALIELLLTFLDAQDADPTAAAAIAARAQGVVALIADPILRPWCGYSTGAEALLEHRIYRIADGFTRIAGAMRDVEEWTNFDEALVELAAVLRLMWQVAPGASSGGIVAALGAVEVNVVVPRLGPLLDRAVGRARLRRVIENHEARYGHDDRAATLLRLHEAGMREYVCTAAPDARVFVDIERAVAAEPTDSILLPLDHPACYGNDPSVHRAVRPLLDAAMARLGADYPLAPRLKFADLLVHLVQIIRDIRDFLPDFALCEEDGGLGQRASEGDLQEYIFRRLREKYGRDALWESSPIGGGRSDSGVRFSECEIPIEVKAEYRDVTREHVESNYVGQADDYATQRDGLAFLLILDARAENSSRHVIRRRATRKAGRTDGPGVKLYPLNEAFWVTGLPVDPQITAARQNAVVVGLVQGNCAKPSSTTTYSGRPRYR